MTVNNNNKTEQYYKRVKKALVIAFGRKCQRCGLEDETYMYDFHHLNPSTKAFTLSGSCLSASKVRIIQEAKKCIMVCSNCHRKIEYSLEDVNYSSNFNEEEFYNAFDILAGRLTKSQQDKFKEQQRGMQERLKNGLINREELKELIREYPFTHLGKMFNVSDNAIRKWCVKYNLPSKKQDIKNYTNEEWEKI